MKKLFILVRWQLCFVPSSASAKKQWHLDKKKNKNGKQLRLRKKPEVTIKPYDKVITKDAISDDGLFMVHKVDKNIILKLSYWTRTCFLADCRNYL
jgi:hypothetical protein